MIQGNINVDGDLVINTPLESSNGVVKYAVTDSEGNPLTEYPSDEEYNNFSLECKWEVCSTRKIGIDNKDDEFIVNTISYGNDVCIITFKNSKYVAQSLDYGETWELIDFGYKATRTSKFITNTHCIVDYKRMYILKNGEYLIKADNTVETTETSEASAIMASDNNSNTLIVLKSYSSDTLAFIVILNNDIINGDREEIGLDINGDINIKSVAFDNKCNKFLIMNNTTKLITVDLSGNISSVELGDEYDFIMDNGSKQLVAAHNLNHILYSNDMTNFTKIDLLHKETWTNIKYVNSIYFLLTENSEYILISRDGIKWKYMSELPISSAWKDIIYKNGTYYILDKKGVLVSYEGDITGKNLTFEMRKIARGIVSKNIYYHNGNFIITCDDNKLFTSNNGINWKVCENDNLGDCNLYILDDCINIYNGYNKINKLIITGVLNDYIENTMNGVNIEDEFCVDAYLPPVEKLSLPESGNWHSICYGNGAYVIVSNDIDKSVLYSYDSINWMKTTSPIYGVDVCYGDMNGKFVTCGGAAAYSEDGITWHACKVPDDCDYLCNSVCCDDSHHEFVILPIGVNKALYSYDGINWEWSNPLCTDGLQSDNSEWEEVCYRNGIFVAIQWKSNIASYSYDGINWTQTTLPVYSTWRSICYGDGKFVAISDNYSTMGAYSEDGINWTPMTLPERGHWIDITFGGGKFIITSANPHNIAYSEDGINWSHTISLGMGVSRKVCYNDGVFITPLSNTGNYLRIRESDLNNQYLLSKKDGAELYTVNAGTKAMSNMKTFTDQSIKDIIYVKKCPLAISRDNDDNMIRIRDYYNSENLKYQFSGENISNPLVAYGRASIVLLDSTSRTICVVDLLDERCEIITTDTISEGDTILDLKYINGLFLAIGKKSLYYSDFGFKWHKKDINNDEDIVSSILSGGIVYIPESSKLLIVNTSFKDNSYIAEYNNLLGTVKHFNDATYTLSEVTNHVNKLLDISVID